MTGKKSQYLFNSHTYETKEIVGSFVVIDSTSFSKFLLVKFESFRLSLKCPV